MVGYVRRLPPDEGERVFPDLRDEVLYLWLPAALSSAGDPSEHGSDVRPGVVVVPDRGLVGCDLRDPVDAQSFVAPASASLRFSGSATPSWSPSVAYAAHVPGKNCIGPIAPADGRRPWTSRPSRRHGWPPGPSVEAGHANAARWYLVYSGDLGGGAVLDKGTATAPADTTPENRHCQRHHEHRRREPASRRRGGTATSHRYPMTAGRNLINTGGVAADFDAVVFDLGGVLIDWNPRHLYRQLFADEAEMEHFLANVCTLDWHVAHDLGESTPTPAPNSPVDIRSTHR